jgi:hypothetical protein
MISSLAARLSNLDATSPRAAGLITFPIGALYHASEAQRLKFKDRVATPDRWRDELNSAKAFALSLDQGTSSKEHDWLAIVHFNSFLMRVDIGFERLLAHVTGITSGKIDELEPAAIAKGIDFQALRRWKNIRKNEVNAMKHRSPEVLESDRIQFSEALAALEDLVTLVEGHL